MSDVDNNEEGASAPSQSSDRNWMSLRKFAVLMEISYHTAMRWVFEERVKTVIVGGRHRVYEDEIRYILDNGTRLPNPEKHGKFGKPEKKDSP